MRGGAILKQVALVCILLAIAFSLPLKLTENAKGTSVGPAIISTDTTWSLSNSPYWVEGNITVALGSTLTLEPGVEVRFNGYYSLYINGTLMAIGSSVEMILITSNKTAPSYGDWRGIQINSTGHGDIKFCGVSYSTGSLILKSSGNNVTDSIISNNSYGISLSYSTDSKIRNNNVSSNNGWGIELYESSDNEIAYNNITGSWAGIRLLSTSDNNTIAGNRVSNNTEGIILDAAPRNNITSNNVSLSSQNGILLLSSSENTITNNNIELNNYGIRMSDSWYSRIYHNYFIDNAHQADDAYGIVNYWNDAYPSGGNYWSDWSPACADSMKGSGQDISGPDGICDIQYDIDADSADHYPLKYPWVPLPDIEKPVISNVEVKPQSQIPGGSVNITAEVTDNSGTVDLVKVQVIAPDGTEKGNFTLEKTAGDKYHYVYNIDTSADIGTYIFVVWAADQSSNVQKSAENSFTVMPSTEPPRPDFLRDWWWLLVIALVIAVLIIMLLRLRRKNEAAEAPRVVIPQVEEGGEVMPPSDSE